ncbi:MAG: hypothetical protein SP4CHLAM5_08150 [Chlamydiia bacterium]|nr:hypothetical protein [Chlamydiia bacterium]MCH9618678.1 hypothetical protein [Chlamydiia bacterium]MCH9624419.1 hypothetical protein [Chlamydiia bacterium]
MNLVKIGGKMSENMERISLLVSKAITQKIFPSRTNYFYAKGDSDKLHFLESFRFFEVNSILE